MMHQAAAKPVLPARKRMVPDSHESLRRLALMNLLTSPLRTWSDLFARCPSENAVDVERFVDELEAGHDAYFRRYL